MPQLEHTADTIYRDACRTGSIGHGVFAALSKAVYQSNVSDVPIDWRILKSSANTFSGYFGQAYVNEKLSAIIVAHRGTDSIIDLVQSGRQLWMHREIAQVEPANKFLLDIIKRHPRYTIYQTGHSLGAAVAEILSCVHAIPVVGFDSPGAENSFLVYSPGGDFSRCRIIAYLTRPTTINTIQRHLGSVYQIFKPSLYLRESKFCYSMLPEHTIDDISPLFVNTTCPVEIARINSWPLSLPLPLVGYYIDDDVKSLGTYNVSKLRVEDCMLEPPISKWDSLNFLGRAVLTFCLPMLDAIVPKLAYIIALLSVAASLMRMEESYSYRLSVPVVATLIFNCLPDKIKANRFLSTVVPYMLTNYILDQLGVDSIPVWESATLGCINYAGRYTAAFFQQPAIHVTEQQDGGISEYDSLPVPRAMDMV